MSNILKILFVALVFSLCSGCNSKPSSTQNVSENFRFREIEVFKLRPFENGYNYQEASI